MPQLFDITNWHLHPWFNTGGTRDKKYVQDPNTGSYYYFKKSFKRGTRDYFFEFWSEIIASELGKLLGFNVLQYDIAIFKNEMGCISESMIEENETLVVGGRYLQAYDVRFDPTVKEGRRFHSFQLIEETLKFFQLDHIEGIIEIIIFDAILGNGDRHQENWAFITKPTFLSTGIGEMGDAVKSGEFDRIPSWIKSIYRFLFDFNKREIKPAAKVAELKLQKTKSLAPIFDNGSSLGRELDTAKIRIMLNDENAIISYVKKGLSEIHWHNQKLNHHDLVRELATSAHSEIVLNTIRRVADSFNRSSFEDLILSIDHLVPMGMENFKLPLDRKRLILKLVTLRIEQLKSLANGGV